MTRARFLPLLGEWTRGDGPLYARLAEAVRGAIERGEIAAGTRLPAQRVLARWLEVSRTTIVLAYEALASERWLESRHGSGTIVLRAPGRDGATRPGAAAVLTTRNAVFRALVERTGAEVAFVGAHFDGPALPFAPIWKAAQRDVTKLLRGHGYVPLGLPELRAAVAAHLDRAGLPTRPEQVLVTNGAQQAIGLVASLLVETGDPVLLEDPTYPGAIDAFTSFGARLTGVALGPAGLEAETLRDAVERTSPRVVYLVPTCHNPTGTVLDEAGRRAIVRVLDGAGAVVVEDTTLADLTLDGSAPRPLAAFAREATVLTVGSLGKLYWGGLRIGWLRGPEPMVARLSRLKAVADLGGSLLSQAVATHVLPRAKQLADARRRQVRTCLEHTTRLLARHLPEWGWRRPAGGLSLWVRLPAGDAPAFAAVALRHGVAIVPGTVHSCGDRWADHVRLPFVADPRVTEDGIRRLATAWAEYAPERRAPRRGVGVVV